MPHFLRVVISDCAIVDILPITFIWMYSFISDAVFVNFLSVYFIVCCWCGGVGMVVVYCRISIGFIDSLNRPFRYCVLGGLGFESLVWLLTC